MARPGRQLGDLAGPAWQGRLVHERSVPGPSVLGLGVALRFAAALPAEVA